MEWISVKDRLPKPQRGNRSYSETVMISDGKNISIGYHKYEYIAEDSEDPLQYSSDVWEDDANLLTTDYLGWPEVTHWAMMPETPKE